MTPENWRPMETAPKDGTIVRLLVDYSDDDACHPLEDATITHTIGGCTDDHTGLSEGWKFAGWSWEHDCFCEGRGKPIGWLPFAPVPLGVPVTVPLNRPADAAEAQHAMEIGACLPNGVLFDAFGRDRVRYVRVTLHGSHLILHPNELAAWKAGEENPDQFTYTDVYLSEEEADALPEFDGF